MSTQISKFLSYVLRHAPESIGLTLDEQGWAEVPALLEKANGAGTKLDQTTLERVVAESEKKRFTLSVDGTRIRAAQGHSVAVELGNPAHEPPIQLFHGTATRFLSSIHENGLVAGRRQQVHLSAETDTAIKVGLRHGKPVVLTIASGKMFIDGFLFFLADNGVWLTDHVPTRYILCDDDNFASGGQR